MAANEIDPFELWRLINSHFGDEYFKCVLENEYGIYDDHSNDENGVTWR
jgi:hypothetical protein